MKKVFDVKKIFIALSAIMFSLSSFGSVAEGVKPLKVYNTPKPAVKVDPDYPGKAAKRKYEGWVILDVDVAEDGAVEKVYVKNSYGEKSFVSAATEAVEQWQYKPKGKPTKQFLSKVKIDFKKGNKSISKMLGRKYKKINEMLSNNQLDDALESLQDISLNKLDSIKEINLALSLWVAYGKKINDPILQVHYLSQMNLDTRKGDVNYTFALLKQKLILQLQLNQLVELKRTIKDIIKMKPAKELVPQFKQVGEQVDALAHSEEAIKVPARIIENAALRHSLARNKFSVANVNGKLEQISVRCENGVKDFPIDQLEKLSVPRNWKNCYLDISGEKGTTFTLIEHPVGKKAKKKSQ